MQPVLARGLGPLLLAAAALVAFLALWIVVPPPAAPLLPLAVGAPEVSPWLVLASGAVGIVALVLARDSRAARLAVVVAVAAAVTSASPLVRLPSVIRQFDQAMADGPGAGMVRHVPDPVAARLRARPVSARDFVLGLEPASASTSRDVAFARPNGQTRSLTIYRPHRGGPFPVVVQIYGGAWQRGSPRDDEVFARVLTGIGFVVVAVDYRHAPGARWPAQIDDVRAAIAWIGEHGREYGGDPTRMALVGRSAGAQLALVAAYDRPAPGVRAVVSYYGPVDLAEGWRHPPSPDPLGARPILEAFIGGPPDARAEAYREASPLTHVTAAAPPTLLVYGARDHVVEARFGRALQARLRRAGATSVLLEIPWAEHAFDSIPNGLSGQLSLYYTVRFLAWALYPSPPA